MAIRKGFKAAGSRLTAKRFPAADTQGWLLKRTTLLERLLLIGSGVMMLIPTPLWDAMGIGLLIFVFVLQALRGRLEPDLQALLSK